MVKRAVFLDRDGVLVQNVPRDGRWLAPRVMEEFSLYPDALAGTGQLRRAGFVAVVVTNQPDIGNGLMSIETLETMHIRLTEALPVTAIFTCPHRQDTGCNCRKPRPGLLLRAAAELELNLANSWMVGDRASDIEAGHAVGCRGVFVDRGTGGAGASRPEAVVGSLSEAVAYILGQSGGGDHAER